MAESVIHAVTGAFGYSGKYIARRLLAAGCPTITLTNSTDRANEFGGRLTVYPFNFDQPDKLVESLRGVAVLYNTYWVRFNHPTFTHADAVQNTLTLFEAAQRAGVRRVVHVSITNPSEDSPLEYFRGKARLERALARIRPLLRHPATDGAVRQRRHSDQQHRLGHPAFARHGRVRRRSVSRPADLRR